MAKDKYIHVRATEQSVARLTRLTDVLTASQADVVANALKVYEWFYNCNRYNETTTPTRAHIDIDTGDIYISSEVEKELLK